MTLIGSRIEPKKIISYINYFMRNASTTLVEINFIRATGGRMQKPQKLYHFVINVIRYTIMIIVFDIANATNRHTFPFNNLHLNFISNE